MTCGCASSETSKLLMGGMKKKRSTTTKKRSTTTTKKRSRVKKSTTKKGMKKSSKRMRGGATTQLPEDLTGSRIPLRVQSSPDWHMPNTSSPPPYAIDLGEAMQSYLFGRPTPNGKDFMVASGLVERSKGVIDMVGGKKKRTTTLKKKRTTTLKKKRTTTPKKKRTARK